jgi:interferon-induced GTP-binding protein Mx1
MAAAREMDSILGSSTMPETLGDSQLQGEEISSLNPSYSERGNRLLLDVVDKLRNFNIVKEGIELPSIVVVGDQSSGKSSLLESLAGISLGICSTRVPLILRLQKSEAEDCGIVIEYKDKKKHITESEIAHTLKWVTKEIAGSSKGISDTPVTLHVKKIDALDLTMVDLPRITREAEDIYRQISKIVTQYISPKESIILNVLSITEDFPNCESVRMSVQVDKSGERTLAVVPIVNEVPEGLMDDVNGGLGYVYVRKRVGDESHEEAKKREAELFRSHSELNKYDKYMVGIPVLAKNLCRFKPRASASVFLI